VMGAMLLDVLVITAAGIYIEDETSDEDKEPNTVLSKYDCASYGNEFCGTLRLKSCRDTSEGFECAECLAGAVSDASSCIDNEWSWSGWASFIEVNNSTMLIKTRVRKCMGFDGAVGNPENCAGENDDGKESSRVIYTKSTSPATWEAARQDCLQQGGRLFDEVNATRSEIVDICSGSAFATTYFWTLIWAEAFSKTFINHATGEEIDSKWINWLNSWAPESASSRSVDYGVLLHCNDPRGFQYQWNDLPASETYHYVCNVS